VFRRQFLFFKFFQFLFKQIEFLRKSLHLLLRQLLILAHTTLFHKIKCLWKGLVNIVRILKLSKVLICIYWFGSLFDNTATLYLFSWAYH